MKKLIAAFAVAISLLTLISNEAFADYEVKAGDTMSEIAATQGVTLQQLATLNPQIVNLDLIFVGQEIKTDGATAAPTMGVTSADKDLLARLVHAEAVGEPYAGKVAVAAVVLNRVDNADFPNTIHDVVYQKGQFSPVTNGSINAPADAESIRAVDEAIAENRAAGGSLYFYNPMIASSRWLDGRTTTLVIGNQVFKR